MAKSKDYVRLHLRVPKEVGDYWRGRRQASRTFSEASLPMIQEDGESLASVTARLRMLLEEDRESHEADIRRHAEINILQQRVQLAGGAMLQDATLDAHALEARDRYAAWRKLPAHKRKGTPLQWCDREIRRTPVLKERFGTPDAFLAFLGGGA